ncbi:hypothetical protein [Streptomyces lanatus]|uniref:Uncharacterized protein n=1 Tax=Streptomyces lanatus TaxID=66900 RepID=A0ABV1XL95_9ACTN|nr:hypothetical protein [Streptomyces lanatus]GHG98668.1 hypothetical protein GCM10018780_24600 [Streptomyces lanatus]
MSSRAEFGGASGEVCGHVAEFVHGALPADVQAHHLGVRFGVLAAVAAVFGEDRAGVVAVAFRYDDDVAGPLAVPVGDAGFRRVGFEAGNDGQRLGVEQFARSFQAGAPTG